MTSTGPPTLMLWTWRRHRVALCAFLAAVAGIVAFARCAGFAFVYDDHWTVEDAHVHMPFGRLVAALARGAGRELHIPDETRPAMVVSVWVDHALFGSTPNGYHLHSLALYGLTCALASWTALALAGRVRPAMVASLFFALAPIHAEVVCAVNYREDLIATVGVLVPLIFILRRRPNPSWVEAVAAATWAVGLLGKESAVVLVPLVGVACAIVPRLRERALAHRRLLLALGAVLVAWAVWRGLLLHAGDDLPRATYGGVSARLLATARYCVHSGLAALAPVRPSPDYAREPLASPLWLLPFAAWVAAIALLARRRSTRLLALGLAWLLLAPLPSSPLLGPVNERADRYVFLSVFGAGIVYGWAATFLGTPSLARWRIAAGAAACFALWVGCQRAAEPWRNDRALWLEATAMAPRSPRAWMGLSRACRVEGDLDEADRTIDRALELDPKFIQAHLTRAYNRLARGDVEAARSELSVINELGGDDHRGVARAVRCAELGPEQAAACIR